MHHPRQPVWRRLDEKQRGPPGVGNDTAATRPAEEKEPHGIRSAIDASSCYLKKTPVPKVETDHVPLVYEVTSTAARKLRDLNRVGRIDLHA